MTLNAAFKASNVPCLISDHLVTEDDSRYLTRKSALISPQLVVAASGNGMAADIILQRIHARFSNAPVSRKALFTDFLGCISDLKDYGCTIIGWLIEGRKRPVSFYWNSKYPLNPHIDRPQFVEGTGDRLHDFVIPPFVAINGHDPATNALSYCAEITATLWMNDVLAGALSSANCGGGFDIYLYHPEVKRFVYADNVGYLHFRLVHRAVNGALAVHVEARPDYLKTHWGAIRQMGGRLPSGAVSTVRFTPHTDEIDYCNEPLNAKMYACCFVVNDLRTGKPFVDVRTVFGKEAEQFGFSVVKQPGSEHVFVQPYQPRHIINAMALSATRRAMEVGMVLV